MPRRYIVYDVFSDAPLAGNPLAVVLDAGGLDATGMQAIAREFNLSETVFVLPSEGRAHAARIRIFTPARELPFAGHPTIGAAVCLAAERFGDGEGDAVLVLEEEIGPVRCGVRLREGAGFAEFDCPRLPEAAEGAAGREEAALALGLAPADIGFENHLPSLWSAGVPFHFVPVAGRGALAAAQPASALWTAAFGEHGAYLYTREAEGHGHSFRARMFAPGMGIGEDPATGSAAAALAGPVQKFDALPDGLHTAIVEQGFEMGRPSLIRLEIGVEGGAPVSVRIGGHAVRVMEGALHV